MSIPERIKPQALSDYLEIMSKAVFQAGVSWKLIDNKWDAFREVFHGFDPVRVSAFTAADVERLMADERILRSRKKIEGTIKNATAIIELDKEFGSFDKYLRSKSEYKRLAADMRKRFKFMGDLNVYYFLFRIEQPVPNFEEWLTTIEGDHPRMREMVDLARETDPEAGT